MRNKAPVFTSQLGEPDPIPCFNENAALRWEYLFPKANDPENGVITYKLQCKSIPATIFTQQFVDNILTFGLNVASTDSLTQYFTCEVLLSDKLKATTIYTLNFKNLCFSFDADLLTRNKTTKIIYPAPSLKGISSSGEIKLLWNTEMRIPVRSQNRRRLQGGNLDCYSNSTFKVQVQKGERTTITDERDLSFSLQVTKYEPMMTTI